MARKNKISQLQIRVSPGEKAAIAFRAKNARMGISAWVLSQLLPEGQQDFQKLVHELKRTSNSKCVLAELHDMLAQAGADEFELMVAQPPGPGLSDYLANYVTAMVEYTAVRRGKKAPAWTEKVPPLKNPIFGSDLKSLQLYLLTHSPPPFRCRNIFIDATVGKRV